MCQIKMWSTSDVWSMLVTAVGLQIPQSTLSVSCKMTSRSREIGSGKTALSKVACNSVTSVGSMRSGYLK